MRSMKRLLVVLAAASVAVGCQDQTKTAPTGSPAVVDFQNGTWTVITTSTVFGQASECQGSDPVVRQEHRVFCFSSPADLQGFGGYETDGLSCDLLDSGGNTFTLSCSGTLAQDPCRIDFSISGEGSATATSFSVAMDFFVTADGPEEECGVFADPCTARLEMTGAWTSPEGDCPTEHAPPGDPLSTLILGAMRRTVDLN